MPIVYNSKWVTMHINCKRCTSATRHWLGMQRQNIQLPCDYLEYLLNFVFNPAMLKNTQTQSTTGKTLKKMILYQGNCAKQIKLIIANEHNTINNKSKRSICNIKLLTKS